MEMRDTMKSTKPQTNIKKNHMDVLWHEYADSADHTPITKASLSAKASVVGRVGIILGLCLLIIPVLMGITVLANPSV